VCPRRGGFQALYVLGARKFAVIDVPPIGCCPYPRSLHPLGACIDVLNELARGFNKGVRDAMRGLGSSFQGLKYSVGSSHAVVQSIMKHPQRLGTRLLDAVHQAFRGIVMIWSDEGKKMVCACRVQGHHERVLRVGAVQRQLRVHAQRDAVRQPARVPVLGPAAPDARRLQGRRRGHLQRIAPLRRAGKLQAAGGGPVLGC
jgi:hypothetical protein